MENQVSLQEIISYSKQKESPRVAVVDSITDEEMQEIGELIDRLKLLFFAVPNKMIAFIDNEDVALKIAKDFHKKSQVMYYDFAKRPRNNLAQYAITGVSFGWKILRDNRLYCKSL